MTSCDPQLLGQEPFFLTGGGGGRKKKKFSIAVSNDLLVTKYEACELTCATCQESKRLLAAMKR